MSESGLNDQASVDEGFVSVSDEYGMPGAGS